MKSLPLPLPQPAGHGSNQRTPTLSVVPSTLAQRKGPAGKRRAVWLGVHLPDWSLRAALCALNDAERAVLEVQPIAVVDADRRSTVLACNSIAASLGIRVGHSLNAAIALSADTHFLPRHPAKEAELLSDVAGWCQRYTSTVSLQSPNEVILEVRGSIRLFGGIAALVARVRDDFKQRGFEPRLAMSSTPLSALWLARAAQDPWIVEPRDLIRSISRLPVTVLSWPADIQLRLVRFGVLTIGDLLRLPRGRLARRIGYDRLAELDRAVGRHPEIRQSFVPTECYEDSVPLDFEIETTSLLAAIIKKRLRRLHTFLTRRNLAVDAILIELRHRERAVTPVNVGLARATADTEHVTQLMHEQLNRLQLPAPVIAFSIRVERLHPNCSVTQELFSSTASTEASIARTESQARLLEQLRSRLGASAISSLHARADYRPECAHDARTATLEPEPAPDDLPKSLAPRPLWLLSEPRAIQPATERRLQTNIAGSPEKIEAGWWDGQVASRDYYRLPSPQGALGWVYRDHLRAGQWRLHGLFG